MDEETLEKLIPSTNENFNDIYNYDSTRLNKNESWFRKTTKNRKMW